MHGVSCPGSAIGFWPLAPYGLPGPRGLSLPLRVSSRPRAVSLLYSGSMNDFSPRRRWASGTSTTSGTEGPGKADPGLLLATGDKYWVFKEVTVEPGYPHSLGELGSCLPREGIDTALRWEPVGKTYFFKGEQYWRYSEERRATDPGYPKPITVWKGIPQAPQGAFISKEGCMYGPGRVGGVPAKPLGTLSGYPGLRNTAWEQRQRPHSHPRSHSEILLPATKSQFLIFRVDSPLRDVSID